MTMNASDIVYDQLMTLILKGDYKTGERLPSENELKDQFKVSRNTVRAALNKLNVLGIVETRKGEGTFVKGIGMEMYIHDFVPSALNNVDDLKQLLELRRGIEVSSARLAALNATDGDIADLEEYFKTLQGKNVNNEMYAKETSDFHLKIAKASKNDLLYRILQMIKWIETSKMASFLTYKPNVTDSSYYHYMIFCCIKERKETEAAYMMDRHLGLLVDRVNDYLIYTSEIPEGHDKEVDNLKNVTHIYKRS